MGKKTKVWDILGIIGIIVGLGVIIAATIINLGIPNM